MQFKSGVLEDVRTPAEIQKNYEVSEIMRAIPIVWEDFEVWKEKASVKKMLSDIPVSNQDGSSSCLAYATALALGINNYKEEGRFIKLSPRGIYLRRKNDGEGMWLDDAGQIATKWGTPFESVLPSEEKSEKEMNDSSDYLRSFEGVGNIYASDKYFWLPTNIDSFAQILARDIPVIFGVRFGNNEWDKMCPEIKSDPIWGHGICALPKGYFLYKNKKSILFQDSWGNRGWNGRRILTEDWFNVVRMMGGIFLIDKKNMAVDYGTKTYFSKDLFYGMTDPDVELLQRALSKCEDKDGPLFKALDFTQNFRGYTLNAVKKFQKMWRLPETGYVGPQTREKLNKLWN